MTGSTVEAPVGVVLSSEQEEAILRKAEEVARRQKRRSKIARSLIRLEHSLDADDEIEVYLEAEKAALSGGTIPQLEAKLSSLMERT